MNFKRGYPNHEQTKSMSNKQNEKTALKRAVLLIET